MKRMLPLLLLCAAALCVNAHAAPEVAAPSALLMEKTTGAVLFAKDEHAPREPASVTKIMTVLLTMEAIDAGTLDYDDTVTASAHAAAMGGSQIWLREGERMTVRDLLKAVCVVSGNDAAVALGEHLAGSEDAFVERMNARAAELGMNDTHFVNACGLPAEGHVTSAHDIALMSRELLLRHPDVKQFTTIWMDSLRDGASMLVNTNKLLRSYEGVTGLKTGSTDAAGYCISATAERGGMELIAVVLKERTPDERTADVRALLDYGFAGWTLVTVHPEEALAPLPVTLGERRAVQPVLTEDNTLLLERSRAAGLSQTLALPESVPAPVAAGDRLGELRVTDAAGGTVAALPILAGEDVAHVSWGQMLARLLRLGFCAE
jgi:D-alanyl-D-alanine carboxypeptidase (penicillin-binding protein 5/6)